VIVKKKEVRAAIMKAIDGKGLHLSADIKKITKQVRTTVLPTFNIRSEIVRMIDEGELTITRDYKLAKAKKR
jgi:uncharacterized protein YaiI (UPF0178 family)